MPEDVGRPIEMQMIAVDVISARPRVHAPASALVSISIAPFSLGIATRKQAASLQKSRYQAATNNEVTINVAVAPG